MYELGVVYRNIAAHGGERRGQAGPLRQRHRARGHGTHRPDEARHASDLRRRAGVRHGGDRAHAAGRQLDAARRRRADPTGRRRGRRRDGRQQRRLLRRAAGHILQGARRARAGDRRRLPRREGAGRHGLPGVEPRGQRQGARSRPRSDRSTSRWSAPARSCTPATSIVADDDGVVSCRARWPPPRSTPPRSARPTRADKRAKLASGVLGLDMYGCASRWRPRASSTSTDGRLMQWH